MLAVMYIVVVNDYKSFINTYCTMERQFLADHDILKMSRNSLYVLNKKTGEAAYIHRNAFNKLSKACDYRITSKIINGMKTNWIEVLVWESL